MRKLTLLLLIGSFVPLGVTHAQNDINTALMRSTFKIAGEGSLGTVFLIGRPVPDKPEILSYVLVTAAHVLREMKGEQAILFLRKATPDGGYEKLPVPLNIRSGQTALWTEHPKMDVAVMYVRIPKEADVTLLPMSLLVTDKQLTTYEIHPGDSLSCVGFPYGADANDAGFPVLRSGQIASYPLVPTTKFPTFLFDFRVFSGNSGGPVYFVQSNRTYGGQMHGGERLHFVVGLVSQEKVVEEEIRSLTEVRRAKHQLSLAIVVQAPLIADTIRMLPEPRAE